jgi:hypothetical protein
MTGSGMILRGGVKETLVVAHVEVNVVHCSQM